MPLQLVVVEVEPSIVVPVVGTKSAFSNINVKFKSVIGESPASLAYVVTIFDNWTLDLICNLSIISLNLNKPLDTSNDCASVVGLVAKSVAPHGEHQPPAVVSASVKAP